MKNLSVPDVRDVKITSGFWNRAVRLVREDVIPYQWEILNDRVPGAAPSHCIENFRIAAGESSGEYYGMVFQDSDLAKWLEAVAFSLMNHPDAQLEALADEAIALIGRAQQPDGYLNTYYTVKEPGKRWTNLRDCHELYCAGHMMEAAVAYYEATGKRELLDIMTRMAHHIDTILGPEEGKKHGYPGHQEIELALIRMYHATEDPVMLKLARYFIDERGKTPNYFHKEHEERGGEFHFPLHKLSDSYAQHHLPVREQKSIEGHSVRALYMATGMADVARETNDETLLDACRALFDNLVQRRMYITGGVGSTHHGEAFSFDYDLPNDTVYAETCASIALCFFMRAMLEMDPDSRYADVLERALYNTCLAGMSLNGKNFFYVNPLEVWPQASHDDPGKRHVLPVRPQWFGCACCPPNLARLTMSLGKYIYTLDGDTIYVQLYMGGEAALNGHHISVETEYPYGNRVKLQLSAGEYELRLRIPGFAKDGWKIQINGEAVDCAVEKGYAVLKRDWNEGDTVELTFDMPPRRVYANPLVREDIGKVAIMRGPLVFCLEGVDNGDSLLGVGLERNAVLSEKWNPDKLEGIMEIHAEGVRAITDDDQALYRAEPPRFERIPLTFIPYYAWANRGENEMTVFVRDI